MISSMGSPWWCLNCSSGISSDVWVSFERTGMRRSSSLFGVCDAVSSKSTRRGLAAVGKQQQQQGGEAVTTTGTCTGTGTGTGTSTSTSTSTGASGAGAGCWDNKVVLVVGGTGGVGQLIVASLLSRNVRSCLLLRDPPKARTLFGKQDEDSLQVWEGDTRNLGDLNAAIFKEVTHVICCTGTTAFPSRRWDGDNTPERVDWEGVRNLVSVLPLTIKRFVLVSSVGVTKFNELPWSIMNLFGVLKFKKMGEDFVRNSGLPFTIIRAGRLTDGPYTSYDLNTLLKATAGQRRAVVIGQGDKLVGEVSRHVIAEACIQALDIEFTEGQIYEINSVEGEGPESDQQKWRELFKDAQI